MEFLIKKVTCVLLKQGRSKTSSLFFVIIQKLLYLASHKDFVHLTEGRYFYVF